MSETTIDITKVNLEALKHLDNLLSVGTGDNDDFNYFDKHVQENEDCPACGSGDIYYWGLSREDDLVLRQNITCGNCGLDYAEIYSITGCSIPLFGEDHSSKNNLEVIASIKTAYNSKESEK
jgi:DNA-directed RNA polymerase subunit M/transcription elongation factor TFIIS